MAATTTATPGYRLDPLDRGLVGRLDRRQLVILGTGAACWLMASISGAGFIPGVIAFALSWVVSVPRFGGQVLAEWLPIWCGWTMRGRWSRHWLRPLHLTSAGLVDEGPALPPWLGGLRIVAHPTEKWAAIHDTSAQTLTVHLQITGTGFTTLAPDQMSLLLTGWGSVFQAVPTDDGVVRITWSDIARRMPLVGHQEWIDANGTDHDVLDEYRTFVAESSHMRHDLVLTLTMRSGSLKTADAQRAAFERIAESVTILRDALDEAQLDAHGPLQAGEIAYLMRAGLSPNSVEPAGGTIAGSLVPLRGMFDQQSTVEVNWDGPGMVLDLSGVIDDERAMSLVMVSAMGWSRQQRHRLVGRQVTNVNDESYYMYKRAETVEFAQARRKLGRQFGEANIDICHRPSDLDAQADTGSKIAKIAHGLLKDSSMTIVFRQSAGELDLATSMLGLTETERACLAVFGRGKALWKVGARSLLARHHRPATLLAETDTDSMMRRASKLAALTNLR